MMMQSFLRCRSTAPSCRNRVGALLLSSNGQTRFGDFSMTRLSDASSLPQSWHQQDQRSFSSSADTSSTASAYSNPLDQFRDNVDRQTRSQEKVGRSWSAKELRRKSYDDLHKLWYVLYKERNMLLTEQQLSRRRQLVFPQPERLYKVQKSMGAIRQVLGERKRVKVAEHLASQMEKSMIAESDALLNDGVDDNLGGDDNDYDDNNDYDERREHQKKP